MSVDTIHSTYGKAAGRWVRCRDVYDGQDAVKAKGVQYLPVLEGQQGEADPDYQRYLQRALFFPAYERTVAGLLGSVMRRSPQLAVPEVMRSHLDDLTLGHEPLDAFAYEAVEETLKVGRWVGLVDWRGVDGAREATNGRPFWLGYPAEAVINWREAWVGGWWQPVLVVIREQAEQEGADEFTYEVAEQYRVYQLKTGPNGVTAATTTLWTRGATDRDWQAGPTDLLLRRGRPLPFLPVVFFGPRGVRATPDKPPLLDLADVTLSLYRTLADLEHGRHFTALPTPWIAGWTNNGRPLSIGAGTAWEFPDKDTKVGMLEFTGQGLKALSDAADEKRKMLAVLGARLLEEQPAGAETAEAVRLRHAGEESALATVARSVSLGLTRLLRYHAYWLGQDDALSTPDVVCELNTQFFDSKLTAQELQTLLATWQGGGISSETYYWNLQQGSIARPGVEWEEERELIEAEDAEREPEEPRVADAQASTDQPDSEEEAEDGDDEAAET